MKLVILSLLFVLVLSTMAEEDKVTLCGTELAKARVLLCFGSEYVLKRKAPLEYDMEMEEAMLPQRRYWSGRNGVGVRWERNKRGLVDECCFKACTADVIRSYC